MITILGEISWHYISLSRRKVNCRFLVPGKVDVPRIHCDMGDGREGDCRIYLGKSGRCKFRMPLSDN